MSNLPRKMAFTGERFVPEESGNIAIEHLHRYFSAIKLVKSKIVLDIASGEGYGSDLLAQYATHVYGVDIATDAVEHAKARYQRNNLEFRTGDCAKIPLPDDSVDIIVSFETLEHHDQHEASFIEFKRVLRAGGKLLISSPDKKHYTDARDFHNKFHVKELYEREFRDLVSRYFKHSDLYTQRIAFGSVMLPVSAPATSRCYRYVENEISSSIGIPEPLYLLALASDEKLESIEAGIFEQSINETEVIRSWERVMAARDAEIDRLRRDNLELEIWKSEEMKSAVDTLAAELAATRSVLDFERCHAAELAASRELEIGKSEEMKSAVVALTGELAATRSALDIERCHAAELAASRELEIGKSEEMKSAVVALTGELAAARSVLDIERCYAAELAASRELEIGKSEEMKSVVDALTSELAATHSLVDAQQHFAAELDVLYRAMLGSKSWKITAPFRVGRKRLGILLRPLKIILTGQQGNFVPRLKNALGYVRRRDLRGLIDRSLYYRRQAKALIVQKHFERTIKNSWGIMTTPHTLFIAECIAERLALHNIHCSILTEAPSHFDQDFYIVLCAQMFERLPPCEKRVVFQLEQSVSSRWFTPEYLSALENSVAVLDYSLVNIEFLANKGIVYPHVFYLPIGTSLKKQPTTPQFEKKYDFLFYGDYYSSPRRARMLDALKSRFTIKLCNNTFGEEIHALIRSARAVVNIHYYENALLEMPRIQECLSQGVPILSESAQDQDDYPELIGAVNFFEQNSIEDMLSAAENILKASDTFDENIAKSVGESMDRFTFMFDRFMTAIGALPAKQILERMIYLPEKQSQIVLSLPETIHRRRVFNESKPRDCAVFDGIRNSKAWIGCGSSYNALARHARSTGMEVLTVFEDDVLFRNDHADRLAIIKEYLAGTERWDIFSGMIASVHAETCVLNVEDVNGMTFVKLNRMTSMVFNIYSRHAIDLLADWNPTNLNVDSNTIDRYLENQVDLHIVVTLPFLVSHREDVNSTLWGFNNSRYSKMISEAEDTIKMLAHAWQENNRGDPDQRKILVCPESKEKEKIL